MTSRSKMWMRINYGAACVGFAVWVFTGIDFALSATLAGFGTMFAIGFQLFDVESK